MDTGLGRVTAKSTLWSCLERFSGQAASFVVIILMSRQISKYDYGLIGMLVIVTDIAQAIADSGVSQALIRKNDRSQADCSTAFIFSISIAFILYVAIWFCAPLIASFYERQELADLTRCISVIILFNSLMTVPTALLTSKMDFRTLTKASLSASIVAGCGGVAMAYAGWGVWAIAGYQLSKSLLNSILTFALSKWRPSASFSLKSLGYLFNFGSKLTIAGVIHMIYKDLYLVSIGKFYSPASLGLYTRAHEYGAFPSYNLSSVLQRVTYPVICKVHDNPHRLKEIFTRFVKAISILVFPLMCGLSVLADPVVACTIGEKWNGTGTLLSLLCISMMWMPIDSLNLSLLQARGRTDYYLRCEIWKKVFGVAILAATLPLGLNAICWGQIGRALIDFAIDSHYTGKYIGVSLWIQLRAMMPAIGSSIVMAASVFLSTLTVDSPALKLCIGIPVGASVYFLCMRAADPEEVGTLISTVKGIFGKQHQTEKVL